MATKVDVATAAVAKIANRTLKLLCMVSTRGYAKKLLVQSHQRLRKREHPQFPSTMTVSSRAMLSASGPTSFQREAVRFHLAPIRAIAGSQERPPYRACCGLARGRPMLWC